MDEVTLEVWEITIKYLELDAISEQGTREYIGKFTRSFVKTNDKNKKKLSGGKLENFVYFTEQIENEKQMVLFVFLIKAEKLQNSSKKILKLEII